MQALQKSSKHFGHGNFIANFLPQFVQSTINWAIQNKLLFSVNSNPTETWVAHLGTKSNR
jgi:hypothetical protein